LYLLLHIPVSCVAPNMLLNIFLWEHPSIALSLLLSVNVCELYVNTSLISVLYILTFYFSWDVIWFQERGEPEITPIGLVRYRCS
jgi:hypothetical protein